MIGSLRRFFLTATGRSRTTETQSPADARRRSSGNDADRRLDAARKRLKATIPPPAE